MKTQTFHYSLPIILSLTLGFVSIAEAKPKRSSPVCSCTCDTGTQQVQVSYAAMASCGGYDGKTCNVEIGGLIRSGTVKGCGSGTTWTDKAISADTMATQLAPTETGGKQTSSQPPVIKKDKAQ